MSLHKESTWHATLPLSATGTGTGDEVLALRLGMAVNALRAQARYAIAAKDSPGPAGDRDRLSAFLQEIAFLKEALCILTGTGPVLGEAKKVKKWAMTGGADKSTVKAVAKLQAGTHGLLSPALTLVRNQLVFHWDPVAFPPYFAALAKRGVVDVLWLEGSGPTDGESLHSAAQEALLAAIVPPSGDDARDLKYFKSLTKATVTASAQVANYFNAAVVGFLKLRGMKLHGAPGAA